MGLKRRHNTPGSVCEKRIPYLNMMEYSKTAGHQNLKRGKKTGVEGEKDRDKPQKNDR